MSKTLVDVLEAVKARFLIIPLTVYDGLEPDYPEGHRWVVLSVDAGNLYSTTMDDRRDGVINYFRPMFVGTSPSSCLDATQQGRDVLEGWDMFPDEESSSLVTEEETSPPLLPSKSVAGAFRWTLTPTYKIRFDR